MKKIMFLTGTRADFGHQKPLIDKCIDEGYEVFIFITGMHLDSKYGLTVSEINECNYDNIYGWVNFSDGDSMDIMLAKTILGFSNYIKRIEPDLILIFADRFEALAGAIVGSLNNILTVHVQAGDTSGTIDDSMRHAISKICHAHFVANSDSRKRLVKMGEVEENISEIGTPGIDALFFKELPSLEYSKKKYDITFDRYSILIFHPVTTEVDDLDKQIDCVVDSILESGLNYIVICPNNDLGSNKIFEKYKDISNRDNIKIFTSIDHFDFLTLLRNAHFIIGNSSCGIIEAPCYGVHTINIGSRQKDRTPITKVMNCKYNKEDILKCIEDTDYFDSTPDFYWGDGHSSDKFIEILSRDSFWKIGKQKKFNLCT